MKYDEVMMKTAELWAKQSKCKRNQVGAVIAKDDRIISIGYNGTPSGFRNIKKEKCQYCEGKGSIVFNDYPKDREETCPYCYSFGYIEIENKYDCEDVVTRYTCNDCLNIMDKLDDKGRCSICHSVDVEIIEDLKTNHNIVIHAEANAILFAAKNGISVNGCTLYVTTSPCPECSKMIIQSGIKRVVFKELYRNTEGIDLMEQCEIQINHLWVDL